MGSGFNIKIRKWVLKCGMIDGKLVKYLKRWEDVGVWGCISFSFSFSFSFSPPKWEMEDSYA